jgi:hypothetical protein
MCARFEDRPPIKVLRTCCIYSRLGSDADVCGAPFIVESRQDLWFCRAHAAIRFEHELRSLHMSNPDNHNEFPLEIAKVKRKSLSLLPQCVSPLSKFVSPLRERAFSTFQVRFSTIASAFSTFQVEFECVFHFPSVFCHFPSQFFHFLSPCFHFPSPFFHFPSPFFHFPSPFFHFPSLFFHFPSPFWCLFFLSAMGRLYSSATASKKPLKRGRDSPEDNLGTSISVIDSCLFALTLTVCLQRLDSTPSTCLVLLCALYELRHPSERAIIPTSPMAATTAKIIPTPSPPSVGISAQDYCICYLAFGLALVKL